MKKIAVMSSMFIFSLSLLGMSENTANKTEIKKPGKVVEENFKKSDDVDISENLKKEIVINIKDINERINSENTEELKSDENYVHYQTGSASYYGGKWHGKKTASGERFDQNSMTAAHKTLPFGTKVKVTNLSNGKSVTVRINNRGPYTRGRVIDLSKGAFAKIESLGKGVTKVKLEISK